MERTNINHREVGVDFMRTIAVLAVIAIHTTPFEDSLRPVGNSLDLATIVNQFARFAVPFFFAVSGYYWGQKISTPIGVVQASLRMGTRIAIVFGLWSIIYLLPMDLGSLRVYGVIGPFKEFYWNASKVADSPLTALLEGGKEHLWFLPALLCALIISAVFVSLDLKRTLIFVAITAYVVGLLGKAYVDSPLGFHSSFNFRNGPFFSLPFFVTGFLLHGCTLRKNWLRYGTLIAVAGFGAHFLELVIIHESWGTSMLQDFLAGTFLIGTGITMIALSWPRNLQSAGIAKAGPLVLGIYASHYLFVEILYPINRYLTGNFFWEVGYVAIVFSLAYLLSWFLAKFESTRHLVT